MSVDKILAEREKTHGKYSNHTAVTRALKRMIQAHSAFDGLTDSMQETLDMTCHKIGRILAGDPRVIDHWEDIAGYNQLVADELREDKVSKRPAVVDGNHWTDVDNSKYM